MKTLGVCDHKAIKVMQFPEPVYGMKDTNISTHYVKTVQMQSFFWSVFSCIWTKYRDL